MLESRNLDRRSLFFKSRYASKMPCWDTMSYVFYAFKLKYWSFYYFHILCWNLAPLHGTLFKKFPSLFCDVGPALSPLCQYHIGWEGIPIYLVMKKFFSKPQGGNPNRANRHLSCLEIFGHSVKMFPWNWGEKKVTNGLVYSWNPSSWLFSLMVCFQKNVTILAKFLTIDVVCVRVSFSFNRSVYFCQPYPGLTILGCRKKSKICRPSRVRWKQDRRKWIKR
jgi:hypothetical protein